MPRLRRADPPVLFAEDFEGTRLPAADYGKEGGFFDQKGWPGEMRITDREAAVGRRSLELVHPAGVVSPQWIHRAFPGQETVHVRFYRKFARDWAWAPLGIHDTLLFAGKYDSPAAADLALYLDISGTDQYWSERNALEGTRLNRQPVLVLKSSFQGPGLDFGIGREIVSHVGWDNYYILPYNRHPAPALEGGRWYGFEYMATMNAPGKKDGEVRLWVDGVLVTERTGLTLRNARHSTIRWDRWMLGPRYGPRDKGRSAPEGPPREQKSWIDGLVVGTRYIGLAVPPGERR